MSGQIVWENTAGGDDFIPKRRKENLGFVKGMIGFGNDTSLGRISTLKQLPHLPPSSLAGLYRQLLGLAQHSWKSENSKMWDVLKTSPGTMSRTRSRSADGAFCSCPGLSLAANP